MNNTRQQGVTNEHNQTIASSKTDKYIYASIKQNRNQTDNTENIQTNLKSHSLTYMFILLNQMYTDNRFIFLKMRLDITVV